MSFNIDEFAGNLRAARAKADMSQEKLATKAGISAASLVGYENSRSVPLISTVFDLADVLNTTPNDLLGYHKK